MIQETCSDISRFFYTIMFQQFVIFSMETRFSFLFPFLVFEGAF